MTPSLLGSFLLSADRATPRVGDVSAALGSDGDSKRIGFLAFDLVVDEGATPEAEYATRLEEAGVHSLWWQAWQDHQDNVGVQGRGPRALRELVASGKAEGLVARAADGRIYKIKPALHLDCVVIGYTSAKKIKASSLCFVGPGETRMEPQLIGSCGNLGTDSDREALLSRLEPLVIESRFRKSL